MLVTEKNNIIYIAGFPRSGTTWFANLLNSHSQTIYRHELIGRNKQVFGQTLYKAMKFGNGVTDAQHADIMASIYKAEIETDKPPFFMKAKGILKYPTFHHFMWLCAKTFPKLLRSTYNWFFKISATDSYKILMKETGEAKFIESFRNSLRPYTTLFLIRNPLGSISSHIKGINKGSMPAKTETEKKSWLEEKMKASPENSVELSQLDPVTLSDAAFLALQWRDYHENVIAYCQKYDDCNIYSYDEIVAETMSQVKQILTDVGLNWEQQVDDFIAESSGERKPSNFFKKLDSFDSFYSVFREPSFKKDSWIEVISPQDIEFITRWTAPTLDAIKQLRQKSEG